MYLKKVILEMHRAH